VKLLTVSQQPILVRGLQSVLAMQDGWESVVFDGDGAALLDIMRSEEPDVLLVDFDASEHFGVVLDILEHIEDCRIVLFTRDISPELAHQALKAGVRGILRASAGTEHLVECLAAVARGEYWCDDDLRSSFFQAKTSILSPRESQLILLVSQGLKNKEIAATLSISESTVRIYLSGIFRRLRTKDRYELALYGIRSFLQDPRVPTIGIESVSIVSEQSTPVRFLMLEKPRPRQMVRRNLAPTEDVPRR
jgi:DNA-binding NarL/FixJ family response regulator